MPVEPCNLVEGGCVYADNPTDLNGKNKVVWEGKGYYHECSSRDDTCQKWKPYYHYHDNERGHHPICKDCRRRLKR
jgi:hypothetical protein